jgi:Lon protease-like protein
MVLLPTQLLRLHIFEPRYRELMGQLTEPGANPELGVVLIERGHEVGGGDQRVDTGTVGRLVEAGLLPDGRWVAAFGGIDRFRVVEWLPDDPYPQAWIEELPDDEWDPADDAGLAATEQVVREAVALAAELAEAAMPAGFALSDDPNLRTWQLCAVAPLGPLDRQRLLESSRAARLVILAEQAADARTTLAFRLGGR